MISKTLGFVAGLFVATSVVYGSLAAVARWHDILEDQARQHIHHNGG